MLVDTHAHLDMLSSPAADVLARARDAGVGAIITIGESLESSASAVVLAELFDGSDGLPAVWASVGVHPHNAAGYDAAAESRLGELAAHPRVVAIGEAGLDFHYDHCPRDDQRRAFAAQLDLAAAVGLPIIVHDREAHEEVFEALARAIGRTAPRAVVMHCFSGDRCWAERFLDLGCYLAIGGVLTFSRADDTRAAITATPLERLLLETDCPYLAPEPFRGDENEPARLPLIAEAAAAAHSVSLETVATATGRNAAAVFEISLPNVRPAT